MDTGNAIVNQVAQINISGNVTPMSWYKTITRDSGKPYLEAIVILSDIVYWYRPTEIRDESTGAVVGYKKKFKSDLLQRSYQQLSNMFGISKREATNAIIKLEHLGVIKRVFRTVTVNDVTNSNVLFIELIPEKLIDITFGNEHEETQETSEEEIGITFKSDRGHLQKGEGSLSKVGRNTNTTTNTTTNNIKERKKENSDKQKSFDELIDQYTENEELRKELKEHLKIRKAKKALNNHAIELSLKRLDKLAQTTKEKIRIVQKSIENGWPGFFGLSKSECDLLDKTKPSYDIEAYENFNILDYLDLE